jgi:hypothetical protein
MHFELTDKVSSRGDDNSSVYLGSIVERGLYGVRAIGKTVADSAVSSDVKGVDNTVSFIYGIFHNEISSVLILIGAEPDLSSF